MHKITLKYLLLTLAFIGVFSCGIHKEFEAPQVDEVSQFRNSIAIDSSSFADVSWWKVFNDTTLVSLIEEGLNNNLSLKSTVNVIKQSQLQLEIANTQLYPSIGYGVGAEASKNSLSSKINDEVVAVASVSYTLDLWGRIRNQNEAAFQAYLATEMAYYQVKAALIAQIATLYFTLRDVDNRLILAENMIETMSHFKDIVEARYNAGFISKVDLNQSIIEIKEAEVVAQALLRSRNQLENALSTILGSTPKTIKRGLLLEEQIFASELPPGVPVSLLQRRPSILVAEKRLKAQLAVIGATEALYYPNITLSFDLGTQITNPSMVFAKLAGDLVGPIFNKGLVSKSVAVEEEIYLQLVNDYKLAYLSAFQEVEDALIAIDTYNKEFEIRNEQLKLSEEALNLAWVRYNEGVTSFLEFINLQTSLFDSQLQASGSYKSHLESIVKLYLALGGGWKEEDKN